MQAGRVERFPNADALCSTAAQRFVDIARDALASRDRFTVALAGGSTPRSLYEKLAAPPLRDAVDWGRVHFFWGDERAVPPDHADSNYRMATEALLGKLSELEPQQIHRMQAERRDIHGAASDYELELARVFDAKPSRDSRGAAPPPPLDLVFLGMDPDGHTASLFPETEALRPTRRYAVASFVPKLDAWRMTLTPHLINHARHVIFLVAGEDKAQALQAVRGNPAANLPAQLIRPGKGQLEWLVDIAAATGAGTDGS